MDIAMLLNLIFMYPLVCSIISSVTRSFATGSESLSSSSVRSHVSRPPPLKMHADVTGLRGVGVWLIVLSALDGQWRQRFPSPSRASVIASASSTCASVNAYHFQATLMTSPSESARVAVTGVPVTGFSARQHYHPCFIAVGYLDGHIPLPPSPPRRRPPPSPRRCCPRSRPSASRSRPVL